MTADDSKAALPNRRQTSPKFGNPEAALAAALKPYEMADPWTDGLRTIVMAGTAEEVAVAILAALATEGGPA